jgi:hypothetical protein
MCDVKKTIALRVSLGKPQEKTSFGRRGRTWEDNNKTDLKEAGRDGVYWIYLALDMDTWWARKPSNSTQWGEFNWLRNCLLLKEDYNPR